MRIYSSNLVKALNALEHKERWLNMGNCNLYSDDSGDFIRFKEGVDGDINLSIYHSNKDGNIEKYYIIEQRSKPFPPSKKYPFFRLRTGLGGGDYLINLLLREVMKRIQYLNEKETGKYVKPKEEQEKHFDALLEVLINKEEE